jgi:hypothetical protein
MMKRFLLLTTALAAACAVLAPAASARIIELGGTADAAQLNCPQQGDILCVAAVRMTGYQGRASGGPKNPFYIRRDGHLLAFTVQISKPTEEEINFFNSNFGSPATVRISVLRRGTTRKTRLDHRLIRQSDRFQLDPYFGSKPTFVFDRPIPVKKGNWIALTVPTWAPLLATPVDRSNWWRSSRPGPRDSCERPEDVRRQFAMEDLREVAKFGCTYHGARLLYSVTYVPSNHVTNPDNGT